MQNIERILQIDLLLNDKSYIFQTSTYNLQNRFWFIRKIIEWNLNFRSLGKCGNDTTNNNKGKLFLAPTFDSPCFCYVLKIQHAGDTKQLMTDSYIFFLRTFTFPSYIFFMLLIGSIVILVFFNIGIFQVLSCILSLFFDEIQNFEF